MDMIALALAKKYTDEVAHKIETEDVDLLLDTTLTQAGYAADAKSVGDAISAIPAGPQGIQGEKGEQGEKGLQGEQGPSGKSAFEYAQENGFSGNEQEFGLYLSQLADYEKISNKVSDINSNKESTIAYPSTKAVYELGQDIENIINNKVKLFHATLDPATTMYVKDSGDFTYADVVAVENCKIEAKFGNVTIILNKEVIRNIEPDPIAGRYVEFSAILRNGLTTLKVFLFVYDPDYLPTDPASVEALKDWGDSQYCGIAVQHIVIGDFLDNDIEVGKNNTINAPSTKAIRDYVVTNFEQNSNKIQNIFDYSADTTKYPSAKATYDLMKFVYDLVMPVTIYNDPTGFEASNNHAGDTWHLTGLDLSPYKRIKCYVCCGGDSNSNYSPEHIVEVHLDDRAKGSFGYFSASHAGHCPNNRNRHHIATFTVNAEKTAIQFQHCISMYGTSASDSVGGRRCYLIEGYYI